MAVAAPAVVLAAAAGAIGITGPAGAGLAAASIAYLGLDLTVLQASIDRRLAVAEQSLAGVARQFLQRALSSPSAADVATELASAASRALGIERALLIVPSAEGSTQVLGAAHDEASRVGDAAAAFEWLGARGDPVERGPLGALDEPGAKAALLLLERLGGEVLLPLRHRGLLLGLAVLSEPRRVVPPEVSSRFHRALAAHATVALANTYLDPHASGRGTLARAFDLATAVQEALLPDARPVRTSGAVIRGLFRPVAECGGDLWTYAELGQGRVLVVIGDATGHGAAPALLTAVARGGIEAARCQHGPALDPAELLRALNRQIHRAGHTRYLMTAFAVVVDSRAGELRFANAGQNFPYVVARGLEGRPRLEPLIARGDTLGAARDASYPLHRRPFRGGERLVLFTDGIVDAGSPVIEPYGDKRFRTLISSVADESATDIPGRVFAEVDRYVDGGPVSDDMTIVAVELDEPAMPAASPGGGGRPSSSRGVPRVGGGA